MPEDLSKIPNSASKPISDDDRANLAVFERILAGVAPGVAVEDVLEILYAVLDVQDGRTGLGQIIIRVRDHQIIDVEGQKTAYLRRQAIENTNAK